MQLIRHKRSLAALLPLALACLAASPAAWAVRTQEANLLPLAVLSVPPEGVDNWPRQIRSDMLLGSDGNVYIGSAAGGEGTGTIARLTPDGTLSTVYAFKDDGTEGLVIFGGLTQASDGHLYGTTYFGGTEGGGVLFRVTLDGVYTALHYFGGGRPNPLFAYTGVTEGPDGYLYGTTHNGGSANKGTIYRIALDGSNFSILHEFAGDEGENPQGKLVVGTDGLLYGTTMMGGANNRGAVYRISTSGAYELLYSFPRLGAFNNQGLAVNSMGANPRAGLLLAADGHFYGTAYQGGEVGYGSVYRVTLAGEVSLVHSFAGPSFGGGYPISGLTQDAEGNFYGTTERGGYLQRGSAWRLTPDGTFQLLHGFIGSSIDGVLPVAGILPAHGTLYGASQFDSPTSLTSGTGSGILFKLDLGSGGVLPVELSVSDAEIEMGETSTITWNAPAGSTCTKTGGPPTWPGEAPVSGSFPVTPIPGVYALGIRCNDPDDGDANTPVVTRSAYVVLTVNAPTLQPVDGGGGAGSVSLLWLLLAAALLSLKIRKETRSPCP